ncbi:DUF554 domain-containing protein [Streptococcus gallolyticus]|nr:DUF554 domain-containing protein [Streptococcus gallolyticus]MBY5040805.1 DUF554 domain-containing protein [Streptococcus gallolyticus]
MIGTLINTLAVFIGGLAGRLLGKKCSEDLQDSLMKVSGVAVLFLGIAGALGKMLHISQGKLETSSSMMILCLTLGTLIGEIINIEKGFENLEIWLKRVTKSEGEHGFVDAFVTTSLTICIGAMAVVGSITEGLTGDYSILAAKAVLDLMIVLILTVSKGKGAIFSAIPIFLFQGSMTILARFIAPIMTTLALDYLSLVGSILIFCVGVNLIFGKIIKIANMLPALIFAVV